MRAFRPPLSPQHLCPNLQGVSMLAGKHHRAALCFNHRGHDLTHHRDEAKQGSNPAPRTIFTDKFRSHAAAKGKIPKLANAKHGSSKQRTA
ncbi:hypothetical protein BN2476_1240036 [Paraburkholderia piptadeniae]|uniref:Uncharacterized protein n=1 Tax=Paraburkholderia piptadeniae TaxID=1701573 RepID=A0A1N7SW20_9BURK|nr:hypothetical protein BN2476_1240036 [Paraburkholderia piptadeniae]